MSYGILLLRVVLGLSLGAHGAQKLFGWFGGDGLLGTALSFGRLGFRPPLAMALAAGMSELGGGVLLAAGLLTPVASLAICVVMLIAIATVHGRNGFWNTNGGYELNLLILATAVALAMTGGGRFSLDALFGWSETLHGPVLGLAVLALAVAASAGILTLGRRQPEQLETAPATDDRSRRAA